jgi:hypothetical protein
VDVADLVGVDRSAEAGARRWFADRSGRRGCRRAGDHGRAGERDQDTADLVHGCFLSDERVDSCTGSFSTRSLMLSAT